MTAAVCAVMQSYMLKLNVRHPTRSEDFDLALPVLQRSAYWSTLAESAPHGTAIDIYWEVSSRSLSYATHCKPCNGHNTAAEQNQWQHLSPIEWQRLVTSREALCTDC